MYYDNAFDDKTKYNNKLQNYRKPTKNKGIRFLFFLSRKKP